MGQPTVGLAFGGLEGPEYLAWLGDQPEADYTILMGANTYRLMSDLAADGEPGTEALAELLPKIVFSSALTEPLSSPNVRELVTQDAVEAVGEMKENGTDSMRTLGDSHTLPLPSDGRSRGSFPRSGLFQSSPGAAARIGSTTGTPMSPSKW